MDPEDVIAIFERLCLEGRARVPLDDACAGFACWLSETWEKLSEDDITVLTGVGATLWREALERRLA